MTIVQEFPIGNPKLLTAAVARRKRLRMKKNSEAGLDRFVEAQEHDYARALAEIRSGRKRSHWMWYIFPQIDGLGASSTAKFYAIKNIEEAKAYVAHPVLGPRLVEITVAALAVEGKTGEEIFGYPDVLKFRSCATLFAQVLQPESVFHRALEKYYGGKPDEATIRLLGDSL